MAQEKSTMVGSFSRLSLADGTSPNQRLGSAYLNPDQSAEDTLRDQEIAQLIAALDRARHLQAAVATFTRAFEDSLIRFYLHILHGGPETQTTAELSHRFSNQMQRVLQDVANSTGDAMHPLREILIVEFYRQAVDVCGTLNSKYYYCYNSPKEYVAILRAEWIEFWIDWLRSFLMGQHCLSHGRNISSKFPI
ncbi:hypothetical protein V8F33_002229 [Rhypophila sp. PSN 637]